MLSNVSLHTNDEKETLMEIITNFLIFTNWKTKKSNNNNNLENIYPLFEDLMFAEDYKETLSHNHNNNVYMSRTYFTTIKDNRIKELYDSYLIKNHQNNNNNNFYYPHWDRLFFSFVLYVVFYLLYEHKNENNNNNNESFEAYIEQQLCHFPNSQKIMQSYISFFPTVEEIKKNPPLLAVLLNMSETVFHSYFYFHENNNNKNNNYNFQNKNHNHNCVLCCAAAMDNALAFLTFYFLLTYYVELNHNHNNNEIQFLHAIDISRELLLNNNHNFLNNFVSFYFSNENENNKNKELFLEKLLLLYIKDEMEIGKLNKNKNNNYNNNFYLRNESNVLKSVSAILQTFLENNHNNEKNKNIFLKLEYLFFYQKFQMDKNENKIEISFFSWLCHYNYRSVLRLLSQHFILNHKNEKNNNNHNSYQYKFRFVLSDALHSLLLENENNNNNENMNNNNDNHKTIQLLFLLGAAPKTISSDQNSFSLEKYENFDKNNSNHNLNYKLKNVLCAVNAAALLTEAALTLYRHINNKNEKNNNKNEKIEIKNYSIFKMCLASLEYNPYAITTRLLLLLTEQQEIKQTIHENNNNNNNNEKLRILWHFYASLFSKFKTEMENNNNNLIKKEEFYNFLALLKENDHNIRSELLPYYISLSAIQKNENHNNNNLENNHHNICFLASTDTPDRTDYIKVNLTSLLQNKKNKNKKNENKNNINNEVSIALQLWKLNHNNKDLWIWVKLLQNNKNKNDNKIENFINNNNIIYEGMVDSPLPPLHPLSEGNRILFQNNNNNNITFECLEVFEHKKKNEKELFSLLNQIYQNNNNNSPLEWLNNNNNNYEKEESMVSTLKSVINNENNKLHRWRLFLL